jgi:hypothetical protein
LPFVHVILTYIYIIVKNHKFIQFMIYEVRKQVKRRLNTMHNIKQTPLWLFPHAKCKNYFNIFTFYIDIQFFVNNLLNNVRISI